MTLPTRPRVPAHLTEAAGRVRASAPALAAAQIEYLSDIIRMRTYTGEEGPAVERTLQEMRSGGFDDVRTASAGDALGTVGTGRYHLLYDAHLDHNEIADEDEWPYPPLEPTVDDGKLYGLGASDCKAGVASILYGARLAAELDLTADCTVTVQGATLEEDAEGFAMRHLLEADGFPTPDAVLLAEATDLTLRRGHRGRCEVRVKVRGKAAHASTPELGDNAISKMRPILDALDAMTPDLPTDGTLGRGTQVVTMLTGPHTPNSVPSWCEATIDRRLTPGETPESILAEIGAAVGPLGGTAELPIQPVTSWTGLDLSGPAFFPGWLLDGDDPLVDAGRLTCAALWDQEPPVDVWQFSTNGTYSAGAAGIPTIGYGPMEEEYVHTPLDQVDLVKLLKAAMFYALFPTAYTHIRSG
ncbi:MAG: YgeY family selenium metabolism-linked hydrolase [Acidimicrobiia bacterium]|nr:YgeY family selenium metabolism-linked hydrolase [Acidimicrobiia bacterium]